MVSRGKTIKSVALEDEHRPFQTGFGDRLTMLLERFDSRSEAADVAGVVANQLARYVRGAATPPYDVLARLCKAKGASLDWLVFGIETPATETLGDGYVLIPVFDVAASSGHGSFSHGEDVSDYLAFSRGWLQAVVRAPIDKLCVVFNRGDSNEPDINDGDVMLVDRSIERIIDDAYYVFDSEGALLVKMIERLVDGRIILKAKNPEYDPRTLSPADAAGVHIFGRVRWRAGMI